jgi:hypothetical protein
MKHQFYYIMIIIIFVILTLAGCSHNKQLEKEQDGYQLPATSKTTYTVLNLPAWAVLSPEGETAIGIAKDSAINKTASLDSARQFATVSLARNRSSFVVDKPAVAEYAERTDLDAKTISFNAIVNADADYLKKTAGKLAPLAETAFQGYKLYLFSAENPQVNSDIIRVAADRTPNWCKTLATSEEGEFVYVVGASEDADLIEAWKSAQEMALKKLANYRLANALPLIHSAADWQSKAEIIDKAANSAGASFAKTWFFHMQTNTESTFSVFIMLKAKK